MKQNKVGAWIADYRQFYGRSKREAEQKFHAYMEQRNKAVSLCFGDLLSNWIENTFLISDTHKDGTKRRYLNAYKANFAQSPLLGLEIDKVTGSAIQAEFNSMTCGASTVLSVKKLLSLFFKYLEREGIARDITRSLITPPVSHKRTDATVDVLTHEEVQALLQGFEGHRLHLLIVLALRTGARISELLALQYDDISEEGIHFTKQLAYLGEGNFQIQTMKTAASVRTVPITADTFEEVQAHKKWQRREAKANGYETNGFLFTTATGGFYHKSSLRKAQDRVCRDAGIRTFGFHRYRATFATELAANGVPIETTAALLGHSDIHCCAKYYINVIPASKTAAINSLTF